jgi:hypothetical protein
MALNRRCEPVGDLPANWHPRVQEDALDERYERRVFKANWELTQENGLWGVSHCARLKWAVRENQLSGFAFVSVNANRRASHRIKDERSDPGFYRCHNKQPKPFRWTKSVDQILASIARFATTTLHAH